MHRQRSRPVKLNRLCLPSWSLVPPLAEGVEEGISVKELPSCLKADEDSGDPGELEEETCIAQPIGPAIRHKHYCDGDYKAKHACPKMTRCRCPTNEAEYEVAVHESVVVRDA
jgi:hypothetical protein